MRSGTLAPGRVARTHERDDQGDVRTAISRAPVKRFARALVPPRARSKARWVWSRFRYSGAVRALSRVLYFGREYECPCCSGRLRLFKPFGQPPRPRAQCPVCGALERHRLIYLYFSRRTDLFDARKKRMLHVAPERELSRLLRFDTIDYLSADLSSPDAMVVMDVTDIRYPDDTFDVLYCSHVLEHVPDDRRAMREFFRVLKPGGWAVLQVPITAPVTFEDPTVTTAEERERVFGQHDHVRRYGPDYVDRLAEAGFAVTVDAYAQELGREAARRYGVLTAGDVYICRKDR